MRCPKCNFENKTIPGVALSVGLNSTQLIRQTVKNPRNKEQY